MTDTNPEWVEKGLAAYLNEAATEAPWQGSWDRRATTAVIAAVADDIRAQALGPILALADEWDQFCVDHCGERRDDRHGHVSTCPFMHSTAARSLRARAGEVGE